MSEASRRWVKVWHEILTDQNFQNMSLDQQARFYNLLVYTSAHGDNGTIKIVPPGRVFIHLLQCDNYAHLTQCIAQIPNLNIAQFAHGCNAGFSVTFSNWHKYQIDSTGYERVKRYRNKQSVTPQEEDKEKDKEEDKEKDKEKRFGRFWQTYPKKKSRGQAVKAWLKLNPSEQLLETIVSKIEQAKTSEEWTKEGGKYIPHPATWLNAEGWHDEYTASSPPKTGMDKTIEVLENFMRNEEKNETDDFFALPSGIR